MQTTYRVLLRAGCTLSDDVLHRANICDYETLIGDLLLITVEGTGVEFERVMRAETATVSFYERVDRMRRPGSDKRIAVKSSPTPRD